MFRGEVVLTAAEFALFFEGADLEKRFIDSPMEINKKFPMSQELQVQIWSVIIIFSNETRSIIWIDSSSQVWKPK